MIREFYDGKIIPLVKTGYTREELDRVCINYGERFRERGGYTCPARKNIKSN